MNTQSLIKYPKRLDGCLIKNEQQLLDYAKESTLDIKYLRNNQTQLAIQELEKVNGILTDTIIEVTQDEFDLNKLCYLEEISARFYEKIQQQINDLRGEKDVED